MILDGVDVFVKVVEAGSFSAAARQLGMPATTVSAKIARIEERLGHTLIQRSTRKMHVTPAGEAYYRRCAAAVAELATGEGELAAAGHSPGGLLRITAPSDIAQTLLGPIIAKYLKTYTATQIEMVVTDTPLDLLAERVDLAIRAGSRLQDSSLLSRRFGTTRMRLFASRKYLREHGTPRTAADLERHQVLVHARFPTPVQLESAQDGIVVVEPATRLKANDMQTLRSFAWQGLGIALLPDLPAGQPELVPVLPEYGSESGVLYFVFPGGRFTPINVRTFIDLALEYRRNAPSFEE